MDWPIKGAKPFVRHEAIDGRCQYCGQRPTPAPMQHFNGAYFVKAGAIFLTPPKSYVTCTER